jgi:hypothetical protein
MVVREQTMIVPAGSRILQLGVQNNVPTLWLLVHPDKARVQWRIKMFGTGWGPEETSMLVHIGTVMLDDGQEVWHYFWDRSTELLPE